jgi:hypothetical protein
VIGLHDRRATPAVVINGRLEFREIPNEGELVARLEAARKGAAG